MTDWTYVEPIAGGHTDVYQCGAENCGALVRKSHQGGKAQEKHDEAFHAEAVKPLRTMPSAEMDRLRDIAEEHDPDTLAIFVLHGSRDRGLSLSGWTALEGPDALGEAVNLLVHAATDPEIPR